MAVDAGLNFSEFFAADRDDMYAMLDALPNVCYTDIDETVDWAFVEFANNQQYADLLLMKYEAAHELGTYGEDYSELKQHQLCQKLKDDSSFQELAKKLSDETVYNFSQFYEGSSGLGASNDRDYTERIVGRENFQADRMPIPN